MDIGARPTRISKLTQILRDIVGAAGVGAIAYGAWLIYEPAGFIAGGAMVVGAMFLAARADG